MTSQSEKRPHARRPPIGNRQPTTGYRLLPFYLSLITFALRPLHALATIPPRLTPLMKLRRTGWSHYRPDRCGEAEMSGMAVGVQEMREEPDSSHGRWGASRRFPRTTPEKLRELG